MSWKEEYNLWTGGLARGSELLTQLLALTTAEAEDSFYRSLEFGTGGLRGVLGVGTNRMNLYTVAKATRGFAQYLNAEFPSPSCAIAYDSRNCSREFAEQAAAVLANAGVKAYIYPQLMPTPMLSFAVRQLHCSGGIVITASHNPAKYNGYKVYGADGGQITLETAERVQGYIDAQPIVFDGGEKSFEQCLQSGEICYIPPEVAEQYYSAVRSLSLKKPEVPLNIVYSPLNGAGRVPVTHILQGMPNVTVTTVQQQELPDGNFPTCPYPNPEMPETMRLAADLARANGADFFIATDPDCDRVGVGVPTADGARLLNGNETGVLLLDFICRRRMETGTMPPRPVAVKTIVTTELAAAVAAQYAVELRSVLTGFKFIGEQIALLEQAGEQERFIFGFEESYGYLCGSFVRDKDAVIAAMLICELAADCKQRGQTLAQAIDALYLRHGYYKSGILTFTFEGAQGSAAMAALLDGLRDQKPGELAGARVVKITDYERDNTGLPPSNVLVFSLADGCNIVMRPSGTEPKLKLYLTAVGKTGDGADARLSEMMDAMRKQIPV